METARKAKLRVGAWCIDPATGDMTRDGDTVRLDPRTLRLLLCLTERPGEIVSADELLSQVWPGVVVTPDSVYQAIASLRRLLGDDPKQAAYIVTVPRQGYRMVADTGPWTGTETPPPAARKRPAVLLAACVAVAVAAGFAVWQYQPAPAPARYTQQQKSVAVLPFADLTDGMGHETFADGMTEELIDRFSKIPGFKVPAPTSSFFYKNKQKAVADIARELGVTYILEGSVRKSGNTLRVAARLMKADDGIIIWSETYNKPVDDLLMVQDDIAAAVTKTLTATIARGTAAP
ncbi:MAG: winged helix-turn-helix domain-containing protein [Pseudomonadota bacterium]